MASNYELEVRSRLPSELYYHKALNKNEQKKYYDLANFSKITNNILCCG